MGDQRSAFIIEGSEHDILDRALSQPRSLMQITDELAAKEPQVVTMLMQVLRDSLRLSRWRKNDLKHSTICQPGDKSRSSYIQLVGHRSRSGQYQPAHRPRTPRRLAR